MFSAGRDEHGETRASKRKEKKKKTSHDLETIRGSMLGDMVSFPP